MTETPLHTPPHIPRWWILADAAGLVLAVLVFLTDLLPSLDRNRIWSYAAGEWLIDYSGGFVRRGLGGELIGALPGSERAGLIVVVVLLFLGVCGLIFGLVLLTLRTTGSAWPLLLWLAPGGPIMGTAQLWWQPYDGAGTFPFRKEYLAYVIVFGVACWLSRRPPQHHLVLGSALVGLTLTFVTFVHEGIVAFAVAGIVLMLLGAPVARGVRARAVAVILVPVGVAYLVVFSHVTGPIGATAAIWNSLEPGTRAWLDDKMPEALLFVQFLSPEAVRGITQRMVFDSGDWRLWLIVSGAALLFAWSLARVVDPRRSLLIPVTGLFVGLGLGVGALSYLAHDVGRWTSWAVLIGLAVSFAWINQRPGESRQIPARWLVALVVAALVATVLLGLPLAGDPRGLLWGG